MTHTNVYAEDFENIKLSVVEKKGYTGLKIEFLPNTDQPLAAEPNGALTLWGFTKERLVSDIELMLSVAKGATPQKVKPAGTLGE